LKDWQKHSTIHDVFADYLHPYGGALAFNWMCYAVKVRKEVAAVLHDTTTKPPGGLQTQISGSRSGASHYHKPSEDVVVLKSLPVYESVIKNIASSIVAVVEESQVYYS
jgi:hypothetical protein